LCVDQASKAASATVLFLERTLSLALKAAIVESVADVDVCEFMLLQEESRAAAQARISICFI
jgi:hypothetical protein